MRPIFYLFTITTILLSSCSSTYKASQTSDDLYYSPGSSNVASTSSSSSGQVRDEYYSTAPSDRYVRMKTVDQTRWSYFDDYNNYDSYYAPTPIGSGGYYGYGYSPYANGYGFGFPAMSIGLGYWDPYFGWNNYFMWNTCYNPYFYNPYYGGSVMVVKSNGLASSPVYTHLSTFNPASYHRSGDFINGNNNRFYRPASVTSSSSPYNSGTGARFNNGNTSRSNNNNNSFYRANNNNAGPSGGSGSFSQPVRTYSPSSGGSGSSGGGGGSFSRPGGSGTRH